MGLVCCASAVLFMCELIRFKSRRRIDDHPDHLVIQLEMVSMSNALVKTPCQRASRNSGVCGAVNYF